MRRFSSLLIAFIVLAGACGGSSSSESGAVPGAADPDDSGGGWPHDFVVEALDGSTIDAGDFAGQDLVLWFWAPW